MGEQTKSETPAAKTAEASVLKANRDARTALSDAIDPKVRDAAAKAVKRKPAEVIGARALGDGKFSVVVQSDDGVVEKLEG